MKKLLLSLILVASVLTVKADGIILQSLTAGAASNILSGAYKILGVTVVATTTNLTTVKFYDSSTTTTNVTNNAYISWASYATNFNYIFTNEANVIITNSYAGLYTGPTTNAATTNEMKKIWVQMAPPSSTVSMDTYLGAIAGLTAVPDQNCSVIINYKGKTP